MLWRWRWRWRAGAVAVAVSVAVWLWLWRWRCGCGGSIARSVFARSADGVCPIGRWSLPDRPMEFARSPDGICPIGRWSLPDRPMEFARSHNRSAADRTYRLTNINRVVCRFKKYDLNSTNPRLLLGIKQVAIRK